MIGNQRDRYVSWALGAMAGISIGMSILDVTGFAPGWAARLTPLFVGVLLLYVVLERERVDSIKYIVRRLDKGVEKLRMDMRQANGARRKANDGNASSKDRPSADAIRSIPWRGLIFRSNTEVKVAKALDNANVLFLPPTKVRFSVNKTSRQSREIDFLVFVNGQWSILEVDGPHHHAAADQARDQQFRAQGLVSIQRFSADDCYHDPEGVVRLFLSRIGDPALDPAMGRSGVSD